jgi:hypothetical protein
VPPAFAIVNGFWRVSIRWRLSPHGNRPQPLLEAVSHGAGRRRQRLVTALAVAKVQLAVRVVTLVAFKC